MGVRDCGPGWLSAPSVPRERVATHLYRLELMWGVRDWEMVVLKMLVNEGWSPLEKGDLSTKEEERKNELNMY